MRYQVPRVSTFEQISGPRTNFPIRRAMPTSWNAPNQAAAAPAPNASMQQAPAHWAETKAIMEA
jgi:hypothetical protein